VIDPNNVDFWGDAVAFIIDPELVKESGFFVFRGSNIHEREKAACQAAGISIEYTTGGLAGRMAEVQALRPIPLASIYGGILMDKRLKNRMILFLTKLAAKDPQLCFPLYSKRMKIIWSE